VIDPNEPRSWLVPLPSSRGIAGACEIIGGYVQITAYVNRTKHIAGCDSTPKAESHPPSGKWRYGVSSGRSADLVDGDAAGDVVVAISVDVVGVVAWVDAAGTAATADRVGRRGWWRRSGGETVSRHL
jgi:hypothetical protein